MFLPSIDARFQTELLNAVSAPPSTRISRTGAAGDTGFKTLLIVLLRHTCQRLALVMCEKDAAWIRSAAVGFCSPPAEIRMAAVVGKLIGLD